MKIKLLPTIRMFALGVFSFYGCSDHSNNMKKSISEFDTISFDDLLEKSYAYLNAQQDSCNAIYDIGAYQNWFYDQTTGELTFSDNGVKKLIIDYEEVGSVSLET